MPIEPVPQLTGKSRRHRNRIWSIMLLCLFSSSAMAMTAESGVSAEAPASGRPGSYAWLRRHVFSTCMYCHISVPGVSFGRYEDTLKHVVPGDPEASRLYQMVLTRRMPKGRGGLPEEQLRAIHDWIKNGARND